LDELGFCLSWLADANGMGSRHFVLAATVHYISWLISTIPVLYVKVAIHYTAALLNLVAAVGMC